MYPRHNSFQGFGQTGTQEKSRVSAILVPQGSNVNVANILMKMFDSNTGALLDSQMTDAQGRVYFDVPFSKQAYILTPTPDENMSSSPESSNAVSYPISKIFGASWDWDKSTKFLIFANQKESTSIGAGISPWTIVLYAVGGIIAFNIAMNLIDRVRND